MHVNEPGMMVLPVTSITLAADGALTLPFAPTAAMRLPVTTMSPEAICSFPFMVTMRAPLKTTVPFGFARGASTTMSVTSGFSASTPWR
jgi:hypothetical protein